MNFIWNTIRPAVTLEYTNLDQTMGGLMKITTSRSSFTPMGAMGPKGRLDGASDPDQQRRSLQHAIDLHE